MYFLPNDKKAVVLGTRLDNLTQNEALDHIRELVNQPGPGLVFFLNAHYANLACAEEAYRQVLAKSDLTLPDGSGLQLAGKILKTPIRENLNGTDLVPWLFQKLSPKGLKVYLLGGRPGVVQKACDHLKQKYPQIEIAGWHHGYFSEGQTPGILKDISLKKVDILLVAMGAPKQEIWLARHLFQTGAKLGVAVGGLFDFWAGKFKRAPRTWRRLGIEWLWRLFNEPKRLWRRYLLGNFLFLYRVWRQSQGRFP